MKRVGSTRSRGVSWLRKDYEGLCAEEAVDIVGGEPKCCKSFLALDLAVTVASGIPACGSIRSRVPVGCSSTLPRMLRTAYAGS